MIRRVTGTKTKRCESLHKEICVVFHYLKGWQRVVGLEPNIRFMAYSPPSKILGITMARVCQITGKKPMTGNNVSHANNRTKRRFLPNLQYRRFWLESENRWISLRVSNAALRTIDKKGIEVVLTELRARGERI